MSSFTNPNHPVPGNSESAQGTSGLDETKKQVDEVVDIMRDNVEKGTHSNYGDICG